MRPYREEEPGFLQKHRVIVGCSVIAAIAVALWFGQKLFNRTSGSRQDQRMVMIDLPPPLPPPAPPPSQAPPPPKESEQKMIEQEMVNETEIKPDQTVKDEAPVNESPALGTSIQGNGPPDGFGLRGGGNNFGGGTGKNTTHVKNSRWGWYANQVQGAISQALQSNSNTRTADFRIVVQIWPDQTGRISRARLTGSTGNAALDNVITNEVLLGHVLQEPPPDGMPMPITLRLTARHSQASLVRQYQ